MPTLAFDTNPRVLRTICHDAFCQQFKQVLAILTNSNENAVQMLVGTHFQGS